MLLDGLTLQFKDVLSSRQIIVFMKLLPSMIGLYNSIYSSYFFNKWSRVLVPGTFAFILSYGFMIGLLSRRSMSLFNDFGVKVLHIIIFGISL